MSGTEHGRRAVVVTGGGSGIGRAAAVRLARDGFAVGVVDIDEAGTSGTAGQIDAAGGRALGLTLDVRDAHAVSESIARVERELGPLHALVNCAGILVHCPTAEVSLDEWRRVIDTNLTGYFICAQAAIRAMLARGRGGRIVNVASVHSESPSAGLASYDASKGGILMLTRSLALEFAPNGVLVNALGPGLIVETNLGGGTSEEYLAATVPEIPIGRAGLPDDMAGPISFLCSDDARYVTGAILYADGGMLLTART